MKKADEIRVKADEATRLAAKVAHELNNPLDAVLRYVSMAQRKARAGEFGDIERYLSDAQFGLQRMTEILRELMEIGREANQTVGSAKAGAAGAGPRLQSVPELVVHAVRTASAQAEQKGVRVVFEHAMPAEVAARYDLRLSQVIANLLKNAIEASPEKGTVRIVAVVEQGRVIVTVEDQGPGIAPEVIGKLFTAFVTTKGKRNGGAGGGGHGLGLAISRELMLSMGGTLQVGNRAAGAGGGCMATVKIPV